MRNQLYNYTSINTYMLFIGWEVRTGKIFCRGLKNGPRLKAEGRF